MKKNNEEWKICKMNKIIMKNNEWIIIIRHKKIMKIMKMK